MTEPRPASQSLLSRMVSAYGPDAIGRAIGKQSALEDMLRFEWGAIARPEQMWKPGGNHRIFLYLAGRGSGKTRAGAEWVRGLAAANPRHRIHLIAPTAADVRDVIVEGESGILACSPPDFMPLYEPSKRRLTWPNGARATTFSADEPRRLRGPQCSAAWVDEPVAMTKPKECWDMMMFGLRLGNDTRCMVTTTPNRSKFIKELMEDPRTLISRSTTYDNAANLDPDFLADIERRYRGTSLGRQELLGEVLSKVDGARWDLDTMISPHRVLPSDEPPLASIVVAVDPNTEGGEGNDAAGIVVMGCDAQADHFYIKSDNTTQGGPHVWAPLSVRCYLENRADEIIVEANAGGEMVRMSILNVRDPETGEEIVPEIPVRKVNATRDKFTRADPVALLAEQGRIHHVGVLTDLEDELCSWCPGMKSPNRMDAYVHGIVALQERHRRRAGLAVATSYTIGGEPDETEDDEW